MMRHLELQLRLNAAAQGLVDVEEVADELLQGDEEQQQVVVRELAHMVAQAGATPSDVVPAADAAAIKVGCTPAQFLLVEPFRPRLDRIHELHARERRQTFRLLIAMLTFADTRRRQRCPPLCNHWWHRDLSDPAVIRSILGDPTDPDRA